MLRVWWKTSLNKSQLAVEAVITKPSRVGLAGPATRLTGGEPRSGPGRLHLLPRVGEHVVALGFVDQIAAGLRRLNQLLVVHHVQQVGRVDEGKTHHRQQLRQILGWQEEGRKQMKLCTVT